MDLPVLGGVAIGYNALDASGGVAVGYNAIDAGGVAVGPSAFTESGISVGGNSRSVDGISIGNNAVISTVNVPNNTGAGGIVVGNNNTVTRGSIIIGNNNPSLPLNSFIFGNGITGSAANTLYLDSNIQTINAPGLTVNG